MVFTFGASTVAANFSYGLEGRTHGPERRPAAARRAAAGHAARGLRPGPRHARRGRGNDLPADRNQGVQDSRLLALQRAYFYFRLEETGDTLLIQTTQGLPQDIENAGERVWRGKLETVGTVIFHNTTQEGLKHAGLPRDETIPVVNTGETPEYCRRIFPAYSAIIGLWLASLAWLVWKRNKPFLGL